MKLILKDKLLSLRGHFEVHDEEGNVVFKAEGKSMFKEDLYIYDKEGKEVGSVKKSSKLLSNKYEFYEGETLIGCIEGKFTLLKPNYHLELKEWDDIQGDASGYNYAITKGDTTIALLNEKPMSFTNRYIMEIADEKDALYVLMITLALTSDEDIGTAVIVAGAAAVAAIVLL
ncbi:MAG: LURP-one-related family protein [Erysipelotrichaceae bacterium]|nr:LURP-one-related family protein [Erysipelotrichaceae bacterium]